MEDRTLVIGSTAGSGIAEKVMAGINQSVLVCTEKEKESATEAVKKQAVLESLKMLETYDTSTIHPDGSLQFNKKRSNRSVSKSKRRTKNKMAAKSRKRNRKN